MRNIEFLHLRDKFVQIVIEELGRTPNDFCESLNLIRRPSNDGELWLAAGVLLPLFFKPFSNKGGGGEFVLKLIKRSSEVVQSGDIGCPGGMFHKYADPLIRRVLVTGFPPVLQGNAMAYAKRRGPLAFHNISLFLSNAVRESWEELRISPFNLQFLGPLPCRPLLSFTKIIFPLAGFLKRDWQPKPNREVEKILDLPLKDFFNKDNYALYTIESDLKFRDGVEGIRNFPCFIVKNGKGKEDILWGATFSIVLSFLKIVFDFEPPDPDEKRKTIKALSTDYLRGNRMKQ
jgi:8-oxo-dGTP pyrophosphatase MutT (NUDIX family)